MKKLVLAIALFSVGSFAMAQQTPAQNQDQQSQKWNRSSSDMQQKRDEMHKQHMDQMKNDLGLSDAQVAQLKALREKEKADRKNTMEKSKADRKSMMDAHDAEMKNILTPDQYTKWQSIREQRKSEMKSKMQNQKNMKAIQPASN